MKVGQSTQLINSSIANKALSKVAESLRRPPEPKATKSQALAIKSLYYCHNRTMSDIAKRIDIDIALIIEIIEGKHWASLKPRYKHGREYL